MDDTMDDTGKVYSLTEIKTLRHELADALKSHANMVDELVEDADELRYQLAVASGNLEDTTRKLVEIKHQLYDLRQLVLRVGTRLVSWEKRESVATLEEEVVEAQRFISTVGGQLWDGARETVEQWRQRNPHESLDD
ncbi:hypothetical protein B0H14DRAFT_3456913 [Mycena olivaceomarginata]|nr:hypothetical protein B0H14DRAFT_3456913 [Mycena olivaceomarginata]